MRLLITRMEPDAGKLTRLLQDRGHKVYCNPLMSVRPVSLDLASLSDFQALILTSKNALRSLKTIKGSENFHALPVFCVGPATSQMARDEGFKTVIEGPGTAEGLVQTLRDHSIPKNGPLLYLTGAELAFPLHDTLQKMNISVERRIVYETCEVTDLSPETKNALSKGQIDGVLLMSPRTARTWRKLIQKNNLFTEASYLPVFCLSGRIAEQLVSEKFPHLKQHIYISEYPTLESLLALIDGWDAECKK